jgi:hypothetical protein
MKIVDRIDRMQIEPEGDILILDREFQLANASYQVFAYIDIYGELEVNLSSSVTGPRFVELGGVAAARALHAAIQGDMEYFESLFTEGLST